MAAEFKSAGVAVNALWPRTTIGKITAMYPALCSSKQPQLLSITCLEAKS